MVSEPSTLKFIPSEISVRFAFVIPKRPAKALPLNVNVIGSRLLVVKAG